MGLAASKTWLTDFAPSPPLLLSHPREGGLLPATTAASPLGPPPTGAAAAAALSGGSPVGPLTAGQVALLELLARMLVGKGRWGQRLGAIGWLSKEPALSWAAATQRLLNVRTYRLPASQLLPSCCLPVAWGLLRLPCILALNCGQALLALDQAL